MDLIQYLLSIIKNLYQQNCWLLAFICRYIPLKQWAFDDSHSPKYEKFKTAPLLKIIPIRHEGWNISAWNTSAAITAVNSSRSAAGLMPKFLRTSIAPAVEPLPSIFTGTMVRRGSTSARSAASCFPRVKQDLVKNTRSDVPSAAVPWFR